MMSRETILLRLRERLPLTSEAQLRIMIGDLGKPELPTDIVIGRWRLLLSHTLNRGTLDAQAVYDITRQFT